MTVYEKLITIAAKRKTAFLVLLDPDKTTPSSLAGYAKAMEAAGADAFLIGSSLMISSDFEKAVRALYAAFVPS